VTLVG